jgi:hypothetical protein
MATDPEQLQKIDFLQERLARQERKITFIVVVVSGLALAMMAALLAHNTDIL